MVAMGMKRPRSAAFNVGARGCVVERVSNEVEISVPRLLVWQRRHERRATSGRWRRRGGIRAAGGVEILRAWYGGPRGHNGKIHDVHAGAPWLWQTTGRRRTPAPHYRPKECEHMSQKRD